MIVSVKITVHYMWIFLNFKNCTIFLIYQLMIENVNFKKLINTTNQWKI